MLIEKFSGNIKVNSHIIDECEAETSSGIVTSKIDKKKCGNELNSKENPRKLEVVRIVG